MAIRSLKLMFIFFFPGRTTRIWLGSGPFIDLNGDVWTGATVTDDLDVIESALNGEAVRIPMGISGVAPADADVAWREIDEGDVIGSMMQIMIQPCNEYDDPVGDPDVRFTGTVDNAVFDDTAEEDGIRSTVLVECVNRFDLRTVASEIVISDADQKARSAILNPGANPDRIAERLPTLADKTIQWPKYR